MSEMFEVLTAENSATITLTNNLTGHSERIITGRGLNFISYAVLCFARQERIMVADVGYSIVIGGGT